MKNNLLREYPDLCEALKFSIRYICKERKMTITDLSKQVGVSREMLSYFLIGQKFVSHDTLLRIARAFGLDSIEDLAVYPYLSMCRKELHKSVAKKRGRPKKQ